MAIVERKQVQAQFSTMSNKLNEIENRKEPVVAFRVTNIKNSGRSLEQLVNENTGKMN